MSLQNMPDIWGPFGGGSGGASTGIKSSTVLAASFAGAPKKATVTFTTAFSDTTYIVPMPCGVDARIWTIESKTTTGFVINSNSSEALTGPVDWVAFTRGET